MHPHSPALQFKIAIVDSNILACMGLERILEELIPLAEIVTCESFEELQSKEQTDFVHYFVSSRIYFEHTAYFRGKIGRSIVMVNGEMTINGVATLNVCQSEAALIRDLLSLQRHGHREIKATDTDTTLNAIPHAAQSKESLLSPREVEVALLLCQGSINKEIADRLNIGLTTVITHRKNIMEKLGARSLADVIIYCVMNGIYDV